MYLMIFKGSFPMVASIVDAEVVALGSPGNIYFDNFKQVKVGDVLLNIYVFIQEPEGPTKAAITAYNNALTVASNGAVEYFDQLFHDFSSDVSSEYGDILTNRAAAIAKIKTTCGLTDDEAAAL